MSFEIVQTLHLFMKQILSLHKEDKILHNYCILLSKITESKKSAIMTQMKSINLFFKSNENTLLKEPMTLNNYKFLWFPLKDSEDKCFTIDLLPAISKSNEMQIKILHCHLLKLSYSLTNNEEFKSLLAKLKLELPEENENLELEIVQNLFKRIKSCDPLKISLEDEPDQMYELFEKNGFTEFINDLRKPNIDWKILFKHLVVEVETMSNETGNKDPTLQNLLNDIKESNYDIYQIAPKMFKLIKQLNIGKYLAHVQKFASHGAELQTD